MAELDLSRGATPEQALKILRIMWAALLVGPLVIGAVLTGIVLAESAALEPSLRTTLFFVAVALLVVAASVGLFARNQTYKKHWRGDVVTPSGYVAGNLVLFGMLEAVSVVSFVFMIVTGLHGGLLAVAGAALGVHIANFPHGRPMRPHAPALPEPERL